MQAGEMRTISFFYGRAHVAYGLGAYGNLLVPLWYKF